MLTFLLILIILLLLFPLTRAVLSAAFLGLLALLLSPFLIGGSLVRKNTGEGKFMQHGQFPILVLLVLVVLCVSIAVGLALSQM